VANVLDQAQNFSGGVVAAARRRDSWARQEAVTTNDEKREQLREAIADLEARYPDLNDVPVGGAEAFARERGHGKGSRSPVHHGRRRPGAPGSAKSASKPRSTPSKTPRAGQGSPKPIPGITPGARRSPSQRRSAGGRPTPRVDRAIRQTGIPGAVSGGTSTVMALLGGTIGLALLFLVLSASETPGSGAAALPTMINSVSTFLARFLSLEDLFPGGAHTGVVPGAKPVRRLAPQGEVNRVEREATHRGGPNHLPGEVGAGGIAAGDLSNPKAELQPRRQHPRRRRHR
jgi:hypothetical protein